MPHFRVHLNGENFWLNMEGKPMRLGFFTSRLVEAADEAQAELNAVQLIREDPKLSGILNERSDPPMIYCEGIEGIEPFDAASLVQIGFAFYPADAEA